MGLMMTDNIRIRSGSAKLTKQTRIRYEDWRSGLVRRLEAMAGSSYEHGILPPTGEIDINRTPSPYWKSNELKNPEDKQ